MLLVSTLYMSECEDSELDVSTATAISLGSHHRTQSTKSFLPKDRFMSGWVALQVSLMIFFPLVTFEYSCYLQDTNK